MRRLMKGLAAGGRSVLVSSQLLSVVELVADGCVTIAAGRLVASGTDNQIVGTVALPRPGSTLGWPDSNLMRELDREIDVRLWFGWAAIERVR